MDWLNGFSNNGLAGLIAVELVIIWAGSRLVTGQIFRVVPWRPLAYPFLVPSTVVHEAAHAVAAFVLRVRIDSVELFRPRWVSDDTVRLGSVQTEPTDPVRSALIGLGPLLLVPPSLLLASAALATYAGDNAISLVAWVLIGLATLGAFPSSGDEIPIAGLAGIVIVFGSAVWLIAQIGGGPAIRDILLPLAAALGIPATVLVWGLLWVWALRGRGEYEYVPVTIMIHERQPTPIFKPAIGPIARPRWRR
jgi:hypothetical protein